MEGTAFDAHDYGMLLYTLRRRRKIATASDLASRMTNLGVPTTERTIWAIERGEQVAKVDRHFAICRVLEPDPGYFEQALRCAE